MPFSKLQKTQILRFLGWPAKVLQPGSTYYNEWIANERLGSDIDEDAVNEAIGLLERVIAIDKQLTSAVSRLKVSSVGRDIELNNREMDQLRMERRKVLRELRQLLDIPYFR